MRYAWEQIKRNFLNLRREGAADIYPARYCTVDLSHEEQDFVQAQTNRMLRRKTERQHKLDPRRDWTASLALMPKYGSAYALYTGR